MIISKDELEQILKKLGESGNTYLYEAQFQFELAWELRKHFESQKRNEYHVFLEYPSYKDKTRKNYDIVIKNGNKYCIIELKYKTKQQKEVYYDSVPVELKNQAAQDLGRYDFLKDVYRIENFEKYNAGKIFDCGYAIFLTNDKVYWDKDGKGCMYENFALHNGREIPVGKKLEWREGTKESSVKKERIDGIEKLEGSYTVEWEKYNEHFKYLIFKIEKQAK